MLFGAHISAAGGVQNTPANSAKIGGEIFQFFSRPPQGGPAPKLTPQVIKAFKTNCQEFKQKEYYIHAPYFINFASSHNRVKYGSISAIREELNRGTLLGAKYMMTHLGSAKDLGQKTAIKQTIEGIIKVLTDYHGTTELLLENSAGAGQIIGDEFEELGKIIKVVRKNLPRAKIGVCLDTCHSFTSGYDWRNKKAIDQTLKTFDQKIGLQYLKLLHLNDSETDLNSHRDRHAHLGEGKIGAEAFKLIAQHPRLKKINAILETPTEEGRVRDFRILKTFK
jgi:deoxyribonuclease-4